MTESRRQFLKSSLSVTAMLGTSFWWGTEPSQAARGTTLKISHQFPASKGAEGDFRDRLCHLFASELEIRSNGALKGVVYPNTSLGIKAIGQFSALRRGVLDLSLVPLNYSAVEVREADIGLMPAVVTSYEKAAAWRSSEPGRLLYDLLLDKGIVLISQIWQAGGVVSRGKPIIEPIDAKGIRIRTGGRGLDLMLRSLGAAVLDFPSNETYAALQTGAVDAVMTSSTSLISFQLEDIAKTLTTGRGNTYWFMFEPLMMSRLVFEKLGKAEQDLILKVGREMERVGVDNAMADDERVADTYLAAGGRVFDLSSATVGRWQALAKETAWRDFSGRSEGCKKLMAAVERFA